MRTKQTVSTKATRQANIIVTGHQLHNTNVLFSDEFPPLSHRFFIRGGNVTLMDGVHEDLRLQDREECGHALRICEMKSVVTCHYVQDTVRDVLLCKHQHWHGSNGQNAVCFADNDDWAEEGSHLEVGVGIFHRLKHKKKNDHKRIHCLETMVK